MASGERVPLARETATAPPSPPPQTRMRSVVHSGRLDDEVPDVVPRILRVSAALGWRLLVVVAALYVIGIVVSYVAAVVVPVAIALLLAALLAPAVHQLQVRQVPRGVATALVLIGGLALLGGVLAFVVVTFALSVLSISAWKRLSWVSLSFRGPVRSQPAMSLMLAVSCEARSGTPRTNVTTTNASTPPSSARPPMSTSAVATPRGTCRAWS